MAICRPIYSGYQDAAAWYGGINKLKSLASSAIYPTTIVDNNFQAAFDLRFFMQFQTGGTVTNPGSIDFLMFSSVDGVTYTDGLGSSAWGTGTNFGAVTIPNTTVVKSLVTSVVNTVSTVEFSLLDVVASLPAYMAFAVRNNTGGALHATYNHRILMTSVSYEYV